MGEYSKRDRSGQDYLQQLARLFIAAVAQLLPSNHFENTKRCLRLCLPYVYQHVAIVVFARVRYRSKTQSYIIQLYQNTNIILLITLWLYECVVLDLYQVQQ